ncbi:MAG: hypothetical protein ACTHVE_00940 [Senegalia sp. (in: firmicutes)]|uniref:hypothetical protein n=1 Tax=Senegalia sp. (in: firmicutes) TaxID=1924098 RepID=UPI003F96ED5E
MLNRLNENIYNIVCSLTSIMLKKNATNIDLNIDNSGAYIRIEINSKIDDLKKSTIKKFKHFLEIDKDYDIELPLYEGLYDDVHEENLYLIAGIIDKSYVDYDGEYLDIVVEIEKEKLKEVK